MKNKILLVIIFITLLIGILGSASAFNWNDGSVVSYFKMDETSGPVIDSNILKNGTAMNGLQRGITGKINTAFFFDASDDYVEFGDTQALYNFSTGDFSIAGWFNTTSQGDVYLIAKQGAGDTAGFSISVSNGTLVARISDGPNNIISQDGTAGIYNNGQLNFFSVVFDRSGSIYRYINGNSIGTNTSIAAVGSINVGKNFTIGKRDHTTPNYFSGTMDEIGIWNRTLTGADIGELYNGGSGLPFQESPSIVFNVTLISPTNQTTLTSIGANFTSNFSITGANNYNYTWRNATFSIWFSNGTLFNSTTIDLPQVNQTSYTIFIDDFILENYIWDVSSYYGNSTFTNYTSSSNGNFTFIVGATVDSESYEAFVYETQLSNFELNISLLEGATLYDQRLIYNGTSYSGTKTIIGTDKYSLKRTLNIPTIETTSENRSFFWAITFQRSDGSFFSQNFSSDQQNVSQILLTSCTSGNIALNFSAWNEENNTRIENFDFYGTFNYWIGDGSVYKNISFTNMSVNVSQFCISNVALSFYTNAQIQYEKDGFVKRSYYLTNASLSATTRNIKLFLLDSSASTSFIIDIIDQNQIPVSNVYLMIQRFYPGLGTFETVEMGKTDTQGSTVGHFEAETEDYKLIIFTANEVLFESGIQKVFCRDSPCTLTFQIGSTNLTSWENFGNITNLVWSLEYNEDNNLWTYTYVDTSGIAQSGRLFVYKEGGVGKTSICNTTSSTTASTITCNVSSQTGTVYAGAYIDLGDGEELVYLKSAIIDSLKNTFGNEGLFLAVFILMILAFAGLWNPAVGVVLVVFGVVIMSFIGLASFGAVTIWALVFIALIILWELKS